MFVGAYPQRPTHSAAAAALLVACILGLAHVAGGDRTRGSCIHNLRACWTCTTPQQLATLDDGQAQRTSSARGRSRKTTWEGRDTARACDGVVFGVGKGLNHGRSFSMSSPVFFSTLVTDGASTKQRGQSIAQVHIYSLVTAQLVCGAPVAACRTCSPASANRSFLSRTRNPSVQSHSRKWGSVTQYSYTCIPE